MKPSESSNAGWQATIKQDLLMLWIIATGSLCLGLLLNQLRDKPLPLSYQSKAERLELAITKIREEPSTPSLGKAVLPQALSLEEFRSYVEQKQGLVLDARPEIFHRLGHVPGALSLARDDFETAYAKLKDRLEKDKTQPLVLYCSSTSCEDAHLVQTALSKLGYSNVTIFSGGWAAWTQAKLPEETNP